MSLVRFDKTHLEAVHVYSIVGRVGMELKLEVWWLILALPNLNLSINLFV